jgi:hypothetical protein
VSIFCKLVFSDLAIFRNKNLFIMKTPATFFYKSLGFTFTVSLLLLTISGCNTNSVSGGNFEGLDIDTEIKWLVPEHQVIAGGPGKDGIPPIENPKYTTVSEVDFIPDERRIIGMVNEGEVVGYPVQILDWHEIVNDDSQITITYCPLTATGIAWNPQQGPSFGTSGLIFRNNLIAYDRNTESLWSQMRLRAINGEHLGASINPLNVLDTTWETWKKMYPDSKVMNTSTGHVRDYNSYAYGKDYNTTDGIISFPLVHRTDVRLPDKARVHGVFIDEDLDEQSTVRLYEVSKFDSGIEVFHDTIVGEEFVIIGSSGLSFAIAYKMFSDGAELEFEAVQDQLPIVMVDQEGTKWNVFGEAVEGPGTGRRLSPAKSYSGFFFAFKEMFELPEIYDFSRESE